jgi:hypothetical protein
MIPLIGMIQIGHNLTQGFGFQPDTLAHRALIDSDVAVFRKFMLAQMYAVGRALARAVLHSNITDDYWGKRCMMMRPQNFEFTTLKPVSATGRAPVNRHSFDCDGL